MKLPLRCFVPILAASFAIAGASPAAATNFDVNQSGFGFTPQHVTIQLGDTVTWHWANFMHTVSEGTDGLVNGNEAFHSPLTAAVPVFTFTFNSAFVNANPRPGNVYDYFCFNHFSSGMTGTVTVITEPGTPYCFGDGVDPVVTAACPCTNFGAPGHGCANSFSSLGGLLSASGTTAPNTILFTVSQIPNNTLTVGFRNTDNMTPGGVQFGDGIRCQTGTLIRFGAHNSGTGGDGANTWSSSAASVAAGLTRYYQIQFRNSAPAFCPPATFNITNGYRITW